MGVLQLLILFLPMQEFLLKLLPLQEAEFFLLRQTVDLSVFLMFFALHLARLYRGGGLFLVTSSDYLIVFFVVYSMLLSIFTSNSSLAVNLSEIYTVIRFIPLIYVVFLLKPSVRELKNLFGTIKIAFFIQVIFGIFQYFGGVEARNFLAARDYQNDIVDAARMFTGARFEGRNDLMGTTGDTINYAYFMLVALIVFMVSKVKSWLYIGIAILMIFLSGCRTVFIVSILTSVVYVSHVRNEAIRYVILASLGFLGAIAVFLLSQYAQNGVYEYKSFLAIFNQGIISTLLNQRLGVIVYFLPEFITSKRVFFGFSPDRYYITEVVSREYTNVPTILTAVLDRVFEDVYWVAMFSYYGIFGFLIWVTYLRAIYKRLICSLGIYDNVQNQYIKIAIVLSLLMIPLNFANQAFESRIFSFYFWLIIGVGLYVSKGVANSRQ